MSTEVSTRETKQDFLHKGACIVVASKEVAGGRAKAPIDSLDWTILVRESYFKEQNQTLFL